MPVHVQVAIVDFDVINFINFETEIRYAEAAGIVQVESSGVHLSASLPQLISTLNPIPGIVQVESFGMHFNASGLLFNGMKVEAIGDRLADNISIDMLCRVLVDLQLDSSRIADDLLSWYQRNLLDMMFLGDAANRNKYVVALADTIQPRLPAKQVHKYTCIYTYMCKRRDSGRGSGDSRGGWCNSQKK